MAWTYLILAGLFEVGWAIGLKYTAGFTRLWPSLWLLALALRDLPVGTAYAVWTGVGTVGTVILGMALFAEPASLVRILCIGLIIAGISGLKFLEK